MRIVSILCFAVAVAPARGFVVRSSKLFTPSRFTAPPPLLLYASLLPSDEQESSSLDRTLSLREQKSELNILLEDINTQRSTLSSLPTTDDCEDDNDNDNDNDALNVVWDLEYRLQQSENFLLPPVGLSLEEYRRACWVILNLPLPSRVALYNVLSTVSTEEVRNVDHIPQLVTRLYEQRMQLTPLGLQQALAEAKTMPPPPPPLLFKKQQDSTTTTAERADGVGSIFAGSIFADAKNETTPTDQAVQQLLPRVTRKEDRVATPLDLELVLQSLKTTQGVFTVRGTEAIEGGYLLRGTLRDASLLSTVTLPAALSLSLVPDFTNFDAGSPEDPVLLLFKADMSPTTNPVFLGLSSTAAVGTAVLFAAAVYGSNEAFTSRLGDFEFISTAVLEILLPLVAIQVCHELGHAVVAKKDNLKLTLPTALPFYTLPYMGTVTKLKESPKTMNSLFDFAIAGPAVGIAASLAVLLYGLQATVTAESLQDFPALPVRVLQLSTLGGSLVDSILGGGTLLQQDPQTSIPLHPAAIAGFTGLLIQCLDLVPLGCTNGGRLSLALLGRQGHSIVGAVTWFALLLCCLFVDTNSDVLVVAWVVNNLVQNDPEIPCLNEVETASLPRAVAALGLWCFGILVLTPL
jgi:Zn-dependent protease